MCIFSNLLIYSIKYIFKEEANMNGMEKMTKKEMEMVTGGKCNSDYGYFFCCPANADDMVATIKNLMNSGQKDKASRYIQFCYEVCGY